MKKVQQSDYPSSRGLFDRPTSSLFLFLTDLGRLKRPLLVGYSVYSLTSIKQIFLPGQNLFYPAAELVGPAFKSFFKLAKQFLKGGPVHSNNKYMVSEFFCDLTGRLQNGK